MRVLSLCYLLAAVVHGLDVFDLRLHFSTMSLLAQTWTVYSTFSDVLAALALWRSSRLGDLLFILIVIAQLVVFVAWSAYLHSQQFIVAFHTITLTVFLILMTHGSAALGNGLETENSLGGERATGNASSGSPHET